MTAIIYFTIALLLWPLATVIIAKAMGGLHALPDLGEVFMSGVLGAFASCAWPLMIPICGLVFLVYGGLTGDWKMTYTALGKR